MINAETENKLDAVIAELAADLKDMVSKIESSPATTQNHYGCYGALISRVANGNKNIANVVALALIKAGANRVGVANAVKLFV